MQVRYCLDTCGVKLKLHHWNQLTPEQRQRLLTLPCTTQAEQAIYRITLHTWVLAQGQDLPQDLPVDSQPAWLDAHTLPSTVVEQAQHHGLTLAIAQWATLTPLQRFALIKLSRPGHENRNFLPACQEFGLIPQASKQKGIPIFQREMKDPRAEQP